VAEPLPVPVLVGGGSQSRRGGVQLGNFDPLEFLTRPWSASGHAFAPPPPTPPPAALAASPITEDAACELDDGAVVCGVSAAASGSSFSFASAATSQLIMEQILAQSVRASTCSSFLFSDQGRSPVIDRGCRCTTLIFLFKL